MSLIYAERVCQHTAAADNNQHVLAGAFCFLKIIKTCYSFPAATESIRNTLKKMSGAFLIHFKWIVATSTEYSLQTIILQFWVFIGFLKNKLYGDSFDQKICNCQLQVLRRNKAFW